jgi:hypothetical protein
MTPTFVHGMKRHLSLLAISGIVSALSPAYGQVDYVKCNAMDAANKRLMENTEMEVVYLRARNDAWEQTKFDLNDPRTKQMTHDNYIKALRELNNGIGDPETVSIVGKMRTIIAEKTKMGCP